MTSPRSRVSVPTNELESAAWPALGPDLVALLARAGERIETTTGQVLFEVGQRQYDFFFIESGALEAVDRADDRAVVRVEEGNFVGQQRIIMGQSAFLSAVFADSGSALRDAHEDFKHLLRAL
ncbi:MAG: cyclic nucleotide-binding domain-containing protein, partial [Planctomycetota bacterium]